MKATSHNIDLPGAYAACSAIARREAKNFYYGFLALPRAKRDAMCAVYAFMRRADDISDDESMPVPQRRELMDRWLTAFHVEAPLEAEDAPVFMAVRDVQRRYGIGDELLNQLVQGTAMDLLPESPDGVEHRQINGRHFDVYKTVEALERYCYLVASVVGLVTIRIFGYGDSRAERCAIDLGKAFQFTNILRDVKEDAERGRIYMPLDLLERHGATAEDLQIASAGAQPTQELLAGLEDLGGRAADLYRAADGLIPLLDADSRSAMRVLVSIYSGLLDEIQRARYQVFARRIHVSTPKKVVILARGVLSASMGAV